MSRAMKEAGRMTDNQAPSEQSVSLDSKVRELASRGFVIRVKPGDGWITIKGRGGHLMMAADEVPNVLRLITEAIDYAEHRRS